MATNWYVNNGTRTCPMFPTVFDDNDDVINAIFLVHHHEAADSNVEIKTSNSLARLPKDWRTAWQAFSDIEHRGYFYTTTDDFPPHLIDDELAAASTRRDELFLATGGPNVVVNEDGPTEPFVNPLDTDGDGFVSKEERKAGKKKG